MTTSPRIDLNDSTTIPQFGYGTYKVDAKVTRDAVATALDLGYRHIDTAQMYHNEEGVGQALASSGLERSDFYLTTKLDNPNHDRTVALESMATSLRVLGVDQVDLFLIHWPKPFEADGNFVDTWRALVEMQEAGQTRSIGVSNFEPSHLQEIKAAGLPTPAVNQIEIHPYFQNRDAIAYCQDNGIAVEGWAPLARGRTVNEPDIVNIADRLGAKPSQVVLAWHLRKGIIVFPKASTRERMAENLGCLEVQLSDEDAATIDALDRGEDGRTGRHPDTMVHGKGL